MMKPVKQLRTHRADVMISSTSQDLLEHRNSIRDAIWRAGMFPLAMERDETVPDADAISYSLNMVDEAEVYLGIFGMRYGYVPDDPRNPAQKSITEMEYRRALERNIPMLLFIMSENHELIPQYVETDPDNLLKLNTLKSELRRNHIVSFFDSVEDLRFKAIQSLYELKQKRIIVVEEQEDDNELFIPQPPELYALPEYILTDKFIGRVDELHELDEWATSDDIVMVVNAIGGIGKSALTWEWVQRRVNDNPYDGIFWYSFYEGGATMESFMRHAVAYLSHMDPDDKSLTSLTYHQRAQKLIQILQGGNYLLVMDGFERALVAYHKWDAAQMRDDLVQETDDVRACTDPRDTEFLRKLLICDPSKILISTRLLPRAFEDRGELMGGVRHKRLSGLSALDAQNLMIHRGVKQFDEENMDRFMAEVGYHTLLLKMIAGQVRDFRRQPGNFDAWYDLVGHDLHLSQLDIKQKRYHILQFALDGLDSTQLKLLTQIAAFHNGVTYKTLEILNPYVILPEKINIPNETYIEFLKLQLENAKQDKEKTRILKKLKREEQKYQNDLKKYQEYQERFANSSEELPADIATFDSTLTELEDRGLLMWNRVDDTYDLHPVIRGYAFDMLKGEDRTNTLSTIRGYFESLPEEKADSVTEVEQLNNTINVYRTLLGEKKYNKAWVFYEAHLAHVLYYNLGNYYLIEQLLTPLFTKGLGVHPTLTDLRDRSICLIDLANAFDSMGRSRDALKLLELKMRIDRHRKSFANLRLTQRNYANFLRNDSQLYRSYLATQQTKGGGYDEAKILRLRLLRLYVDTLNFADFRNLSRAYSRSTIVRMYSAYMEIAQGKSAQFFLNYNDADLKSPSDWRFSVWLKAEDALTQKNYPIALTHLHAVIEVAQKTGAAELANYLGALALVQAKMNNFQDAENTIDDALVQTHIRESHQLYTYLAETYLEIGNEKQARVYAEKAYEKAWADGPPWAFMWWLNRAKIVLDELQVEYPTMPAFNKSHIKSLPF